MRVFVLLVLLSGSECVVVGRSGENVTLACRYDIKSHGSRPVCWARGHLPLSGCGNKLVSTDGHQVSGGGGRFLLLGRLQDGDVSLTILNLTEEDAGRYGCRVDIPGWFNDDKHHFDLRVEAAPQTITSTTADRETSTESTELQTTARNTAGQVTSTESVRTSSSAGVLVEQQDSSIATVTLVWLLFVCIAVITAGAGVIFLTKWRRLNKTRQQQVHSRSASFSLQLHSRTPVVENIYQMDEGGDEGEYERCP